MKLITATVFCLLINSLSFSQNMQQDQLIKNFIYSINGKKGLVDLKSNILTSPIYEEISRFSEGLYSAGKFVNAEIKYGYLDEQGREVIEFIYDDAYPFVNNYAAVQLKEGWTFIDKDFNYITDKRFSLVKDFNEGYAEVRTENKKWNFIDEKGNLLSKDFFDETNKFTHSFAMIKINNKYGFIDKNGIIKIKPEFTNWREFSKHKVALIANERGWKLVNENGEILPKDSTISVDYPYVFDNGLYKVAQIDKKGSLKFGYMNLKDEIVIPIIYESIEGFFSHSLTGGIIDSVAYLIDDKGNNRIKTNYSFIHYYYDGQVSTVNKKTAKDELIKKNIKIGDIDFKYISYNGLMGAINFEGNECIPTIYKDLSPIYSQIYDRYFKNQCLFEATKPNSELKGVISDNNEVIVPFLYEQINYICKGAFLVKSNNEYSIYRSSSKKIIKLSDNEFSYSTRKDFDENYLVVKNKSSGLVGLLNIDGIWIIKPQFNDLKLGAKKERRKE